MFDATTLESAEDLRQVLQADFAVSAQIDVLLRNALHPLTDPLLQYIDPDGFVAQVHHPILAVSNWHRNLDALPDDLVGVAGGGQIHVHPALNHGRGHHKDDEQHEHDV